ncbi:MAG: hypothetical protein CAF45_005035 [Nitrospira sp. CG24E]|nr:MAG: hypothetical protein CAF45_005035 [Nitrospira sp. CG24E]
MRRPWSWSYRSTQAGTRSAPDWRAIAVVALFVCLLAPNALFAQPANQPAGIHKEDTFEQLKEQLRQIEEQHQKELADLKERLGLVEKRQSGLSDELAQHIKVGAYSAVVFENFKDRKTSYDGRFELLISGNIHDRIRIYNEIDLGIPGRSASAEQAYVDLLLTQAFNVRAGVLLTPFGKFNLDHFDPRRDLSRPPSVARLVTPSTWSDLGVGAFGFLPVSDNIKATYDIQVINGLTDAFTAAVQGTAGSSTGGIVSPGIGLRDARTDLKPDNNGDKAVVGRGTFKFYDQYEVGFSGYRGEYKAGSRDPIVGMAFDAEFRPRNVSILEDFVLRSEFARFVVHGSTAPSSLWGHYTQLTYRFWPTFLNSTVLGRHFNNPTFTLVGLYGYSKINTTASATGSLISEQYIIGLNYRPVEDYVVKVEYQFNQGQLGPGSSDGFLTSVAWIF